MIMYILAGMIGHANCDVIEHVAAWQWSRMMQTTLSNYLTILGVHVEKSLPEIFF